MISKSLPKAKFRVGEVVRVRRNLRSLSQRNSNGQWYIISDMEKLEGKLCEVLRIDYDSNGMFIYRLKSSSGNTGWQENWLEHEVEVELLPEELFTI